MARAIKISPQRVRRARPASAEPLAGVAEATTRPVEAATGNVETQTDNVDALTRNVEAGTHNVEAATLNVEAVTGNLEAATGNVGGLHDFLNHHAAGIYKPFRAPSPEASKTAIFASARRFGAPRPPCRRL